MKKLYFGLILGAFLSLIIPALPAGRSTASAEISADVEMQRYGARNLSKNESAYSQNVQAVTGDDLEFSINVRNTSANLATGLTLYVYLPTGFPLDNNSISVDGTRTGGNISNGLFLGNLNAGTQRDIIFRTKINSSYTGYGGIQALIAGDNFNTDSKYVSITSNGGNNNTDVSGSTTYYTPTPTPYYNYNQNSFLSTSVMGRNLTKQEVNWQKNIKAEPGDLLEFSIMISNNSFTTARNVRVKDVLDSLLDPVPSSNALFSDRLWIGDLNYQENKFVKFQVRVQNASQFGKDVLVLSSTAQVTADNNPQITDNASISVSTKQGESKPVAATVATSNKTSGGQKVASVQTNQKVALTVPKETPKTASKNFLFGTIAFGSFWLLIFLMLIAFIIFLIIALLQEKKKSKEKEAIA